MQMEESIYQIKAPWFTAGIVLINNTVIHPAPILNYMKGWKKGKVLSYCKLRKWHWQEVEAYAETKFKESQPIRIAPTNSNSNGRREENKKSLN